MDGYDSKRWERINEQVKDMGLTFEVAGQTIILSRKGKAPQAVGTFYDVDSLHYFLYGYDWGRQLLSKKQEPKSKTKAKKSPAVWSTRKPHCDYRLSDWMDDVAAYATVLGYNDWVHHNIEADTALH